MPFSRTICPGELGFDDEYTGTSIEKQEVTLESLSCIKINAEFLTRGSETREKGEDAVRMFDWYSFL